MRSSLDSPLPSFRFPPSLKALGLALGLAVATLQPAFSQGDPMRPQFSGLQAPGADPAPAAGQIVVSGPSRRFAMVGSHAVHVGETYNGAKLVAIREDGVVWQRPEGTEHEITTPGVRKQPSKREPAPAKAPQKDKTIGEQR
jgi:hypothetical protein